MNSICSSRPCVAEHLVDPPAGRLGSPSPGGTRQSIFSSARAGITLILSEAWIIVGVSVTPNIGSTSFSSAGSAAPIRASASPGRAGSSPSASSIAAGALASS